MGWERGSILALAMLCACSGGATPPVQRAASLPATASAAPLPPGVLAEAQGKQGIVRVEERDGLRRLTVGGVELGAVAAGKSEVRPQTEAWISLARSAQPWAKTALVIGLGTGNTAAALARSGFEVEVAEAEPAVIDFARRFFGYTGHAVEADGGEYAARSKKGYDLVVVHSFVEDRLPAEICEEGALAGLGVRRYGSTLIVARWVGQAGSSIGEQVPRHVDKTPLLWWLYGRGLWEERQELFAFLSATPMNLLHPPRSELWPIPLSIAGRARPIESVIVGSPASRRVTVLGYLGRDEAGDMIVDLPYSGPGTLRYRLSGPEAEAVERRLPVVVDRPSGLILDAPQLKKLTLREILGGGENSLSGVSFSPVVAAVTGTASVAAVVDPETLDYLTLDTSLARKEVATDPRLPRGGVLYDLSIEDVPLWFDRKAWSKLKGKLTPLLSRAATAIGARDFPGAEKSLVDCLKTVEDDLGPFAPSTALHAELTRLLSGLRAEGAAAVRRTAFSAAAACDRVAEGAAIDPYYSASDAAKAVSAALDQCARKGYREARQKGENARIAAERLLRLLRGDVQVHSNPRIEAEIAAIEKTYPGIDSLEQAPRP